MQGVRAGHGEEGEEGVKGGQSEEEMRKHRYLFFQTDVLGHK